LWSNVPRGPPAILLTPGVHPNSEILMSSELIDIDLLVRAKFPDLIEDVLRSDSDSGGVAYMQRRHVMFKNGYALSVISGEYAHTNDTGPFEIAVLGKDGELDYGKHFVNDPSDDTIGYCTLGKVLAYVEHIGKINEQD